MILFSTFGALANLLFHEIAVKCQPRLQSSEDTAGAGRYIFKVTHSHLASWCCLLIRDLSSSPHQLYYTDCLNVLTTEPLTSWSKPFRVKTATALHVKPWKTDTITSATFQPLEMDHYVSPFKWLRFRLHLLKKEWQRMCRHILKPSHTQEENEQKL